MCLLFLCKEHGLLSAIPQLYANEIEHKIKMFRKKNRITYFECDDIKENFTLFFENLDGFPSTVVIDKWRSRDIKKNLCELGTLNQHIFFWSVSNSIACHFIVGVEALCHECLILSHLHCLPKQAQKASWYLVLSSEVTS